MDDLGFWDRVYDATCEYVERNKGLVGGCIVAIFMIWFAQCCLGNDKEICSDSIVDMSKSDKSCYDGAKLKHVEDQWVCSCEK